jgi:hypothetical protein
METLVESLSTLSVNCDTSKKFLETVDSAFEAYFKYGARSSKKVDILHNYFKECISASLMGKDFSVKTEQNVNACNPSGKKKCDIVVYYKNIPVIVFPVKFIVTSYNKNKNNYFENLIGDSTILKKKNPKLIIIPINIIGNKVPNLTGNLKIKNFEVLNYSKTFKINKSFPELFNDSMDFILDLIYPEQEQFKVKPTIQSFNTSTPYRSFSEVLSKLNLKDLTTPTPA